LQGCKPAVCLSALQKHHIQPERYVPCPFKTVDKMKLLYNNMFRRKIMDYSVRKSENFLFVIKIITTIGIIFGIIFVLPKLFGDFTEGLATVYVLLNICSIDFIISLVL
jgi:hypothetical protein